MAVAVVVGANGLGVLLRLSVEEMEEVLLVVDQDVEISGLNV